MALYSRSEAAKYLGISVRTLDRRRENGVLPYVCHCPGGRVHFRLADLDNYIKANLRR